MALFSSIAAVTGAQLILAGAAATFWSIPLSLIITFVLAVVITSYRQTVHAYPNGASAYIVAAHRSRR